MRPLNHLRSSCLILLSLAFPAPLSLANARSLNLQSTPSLPFQLLPYLPSVQDDRWLLTKIRDGVIHTIWGIQSGRSSKHCNANSISSRPLPPPSVLARYDGDVVLRFSINTAQEVKDLAEAINVLFLDVWEFTSEWVDIRLAKDVVGYSLYQRIDQIVICRPLGSFATRASPSVFAAFTHAADA